MTTRASLFAALRLAAPLLASLLLLALSAAPAPAQQAPTAAILPPEAREAMAKGIAAANGRDYLAAVQDFQSARKIAGNAPEILFNLGLAESQLPGRELRAICWFAAYLAAAPGASNAAAVQQQIKTLDTANKANLTRFLKTVEDAAQKIPSKEARDLTDEQNDAYDKQHISVDKDFNVERVAELWVTAGDLSRAMLLGSGLTDILKGYLAWKLADDGHSDEARTILVGVQCQLIPAMANAAEEVARHGDPNLAKQLLAPCVAINRDTTSAWAAIARAQFKKGDAKAARDSLVRALKAYRYYPSEPYHFEDHYADVACVQADMGDSADAHKTVEAMRKSKGSEDEKAARLAAISTAERCITKGQLIHGDKDGAQKTAALITEPADRDAFGRDFAGFLADPNYFDRKPAPLTSAELVQSWLTLLDPYLNKPEFLDLPSYLKSLPSGDVYILFDDLRNAGDNLASGQWGVDKMMVDPIRLH